jgi:hypothetical protein
VLGTLGGFLALRAIERCALTLPARRADAFAFFVCLPVSVAAAGLTDVQADNPRKTAPRHASQG